MLSVLAFAMVTTFMILIMTKRLSALVALIVVPIVFALIAGFAAGLGDMMLEGVRTVAPTGVMLLFAILFFGLMIDVGLFDPLVKRIVKAVHGDPVRIVIGTAILAMTISLDGDGATTYMITTAAMLPLYRHMKMDMRVLACVVIMCGAVMNILPWGGPTARAASALSLDPGTVFVPMIPSMIVTGLWVLLVAYWLGKQERARLAIGSEQLLHDDASGSDIVAEDAEGHLDARRPKLLWFNFLLTVALMACLIMALLPLPILFMIAFAIALSVNYPRLQQQRARIAHHAGNALAVVSMIFAAGIFMGVMSGTKMVDAMAGTITGAISPELGPYMATITALLSIPFTFFLSNDAFYFGMLPILAKTAAGYGIAPDAIARASLVGQQFHLLSPLVPSTYLLVGLCKIEFGEHQRFTMKWALGSCTVALVACVVFGAFPLVAP